MSTELSIIIPVYNGEAHIKQCLDSIFAQKNSQKYEVIVVNDGSSDKTQTILENYPHHIKIIKQTRVYRMPETWV